MERTVKIVDLADVISNDVGKEKERLVRAFAFDLYGNIIKGTPVDTGRARANWNMTNDTPNFSTTESTSPRFGTGISGDKVIYIANGLPYINRLDAGYSSQAPNGIIAPAIAKTRNKYAR